MSLASGHSAERLDTNKKYYATVQVETKSRWVYFVTLEEIVVVSHLL